MTKQELMENYTIEQLAEMVSKYCEKGKIKNAEIQINCPVCRTPFDYNDGKERFYITVLTDTIHSLEEENEQLKSQLNRKQTEINQIDDILNKLFGVTHDVVKKPDEFEKILEDIINFRKENVFENYNVLETLRGNFKVLEMIIENTIKNEKGEETNIVKFDSIKQFAEYINCFNTANIDYINKVLKERKEIREENKTISDLLPTEPIEMASILINSERDVTEELFGIKDTCKIFEISELRQIAEHLLVYCKANESEGEGLSQVINSIEREIFERATKERKSEICPICGGKVDLHIGNPKDLTDCTVLCKNCHTEQHFETHEQAIRYLHKIK